jgi:hypothetical protein
MLNGKNLMKFSLLACVTAATMHAQDAQAKSVCASDICLDVNYDPSPDPSNDPSINLPAVDLDFTPSSRHTGVWDNNKKIPGLWKIAGSKNSWINLDQLKFESP